MVKHAKPYVKLIATTDWNLDEVLRNRGSMQLNNLITFAGKVCYGSDVIGYNKNLKGYTDDEEAYMNKLLDSGHYSVFEHVNVTFYIGNVSRVFLAEITRHRHLSFSVESGRFVRKDRLYVTDIEAPAFVNDICKEIVRSAYDTIEAHYRALVKEVKWDTLTLEQKKEVTSWLRRILPESLALNMVVTGNLRAWYEMLQKRLSKHAEIEIRTICGMILEQLKDKYPVIFNRLNTI